MTAQLPTMRLKLPDGSTVEKTEDRQKYIVEVLLERFAALTPSEMAEHLGISREHLQREHLKPLLDKKLIYKVDGTHKYGSAKKGKHGITVDQVHAERHLANYAEFYQCNTIQRWKEQTKAKHRDEIICTFMRICMGERTPGFKINPDFWIHPDSTRNCVTQLRKFYGISDKEDIPAHTRAALAQFIIFGLAYNLQQQERDALGLSGSTGKAQQSTLHMTDTQYEQAKQLIRKASFEYFVKFGFRYWTFCRPSSMYLVKPDDLTFYEREVKYIEVNGEKVTDKKLIAAFADRFEVQTSRHKACRLEMIEYKTGTKYPKFLWDEEFVTALEKHAKERKKQGFKYLFWDNSETKFDFLNYDRIVQGQIEKDNKFFKRIFFKVGFKSGDFGKYDRANYALRHFGVQKWCRLLKWRLEKIVRMGWDDMNTLLKWYAAMPTSEFDKEMGEVIV